VEKCHNYVPEGDNLHTPSAIISFLFTADEVVNFSPAWRISGRIELPLIYSDLPSKTGPDAPSSGPYRFGIGNLLTQALLIHDIDDRTAVALGSALIFPTTNQALFGSRNYTMLPTAVGRWMLPEISEGSYFAPVVRYGVYVAGPASPTHPYISELQFSPMINIALPNFWFITLFPNTSGSDIRYNLGSPHRGDKGRLFLPADVMLGKALNLGRGRGGVASLEIGVPIVNDYRKSSSLTGTYKFKLEARIGLFW
jgi:hypothetical protein